MGLKFPTYSCISQGSYCCPVSVVGVFNETKRCFRRCLQVSSMPFVRLLSIDCWFSVKITSFSVMQKSQAFPPLEKSWPFAIIDHSTLYGMFLSFNFQM